MGNDALLRLYAWQLGLPSGEYLNLTLDYVQSVLNKEPDLPTYAIKALIQGYYDGLVEFNP